MTPLGYHELDRIFSWIVDEHWLDWRRSAEAASAPGDTHGYGL
jgi:hypothetical protein